MDSVVKGIGYTCIIRYLSTADPDSFTRYLDLFDPPDRQNSCCSSLKTVGQVGNSGYLETFSLGTEIMEQVFISCRELPKDHVLNQYKSCDIYLLLHVGVSY